MDITQDDIDLYAADGRDFFARVLKLDYASILVTDESRLSDFSFRGMSEISPRAGDSLNALYSQWDDFIVGAIETAYGLRLASTNVTLIHLFEQLRAQARKPTLH